jgi:RES domain-containing protein
MTAPARAHVRETTHRLIASRLPPVGVFDDLSADKDELTMAFLLESATNDRLGILSRRLLLLPENEIVQGPGATMVMAAFLHADEAGGRFTDGRLGAWYASFDVETMIAETVYHSTRRLRLSEGAFPSSIQMRELVAGIDCELIDIRGQQKSRADLYDTDDYSASQKFGFGLRWPPSGHGENGVVYNSVRRADGTNVCVYRPSLIILPVNQTDHYEYRWDAAGQVTVLKLTNLGGGTPER